MQAEAHADGDALWPRLIVVLPLHRDRCGDRLAGAVERIEEGVALGVDLLAVVQPERLAHDPSVRPQQLGVLIVAQLLEQAGAALDVAEEKRHRAGRKVGHRRHTLSRLAA